MTTLTTRNKRPHLSPLSRSRKIMQWGVVGLTFLIGFRHILPGRESMGGSFDAFCPFGGVETLLPYLFEGHTLKSTTLLNFSLLLGVVGMALVAGRAFCGWMCPLGTVQDLLAGWASRLTGEKRHVPGKRSPALLPFHLPASIDRRLRMLKYGGLVLVMIGSLFTVYPPLHEFCAVRAIFSFHMTPLLGLSLAAFLLISILVERAFCKYFCPLGAFLAVFNKISPLRIVTEPQRCTHCGRCDIECSMGIEQVPDNTRDLECIRCLDCLDTCARDGSLTIRIG